VTKFHYSKRIPELDGLRGIAIGTVVVFHYFVLQTRAAPGSVLSHILAAGRLTWSGVDLFFVLSGFLIGGILLDVRDSSNFYEVFYTRRFFRIVPAYLLLLAVHLSLIGLVTLGLTPSLGFMLPGRIPLVVNLAFLQNFWMAARDNLGSRSLAITWSLAVEEQFYLTLPLVIRFVSPRNLARIVSYSIVASVLLRIALCIYLPYNQMARFALMPCRADALLLGVLGAIVIRREEWWQWLQAKRTVIWLTLGALTIGVIFLNQYSYDIRGFGMASGGYTWLATFYLCVLLCSQLSPDSVLSRCLRWKWLAFLGKIAYGIYLFHFVVLDILFMTLRAHEPKIDSWQDWAVAILAVCLTIALCKLSHKYFEAPLIRAGHKKDWSNAIET
jgi:peptidoglycan/LPS O-acetylase OafA/YrhL